MITQEPKGQPTTEVPTSDHATPNSTPVPSRSRDTRKKDPAPRGVFRHRSGDWAIRFTCGAGHIHQERVGSVKTDAKDTYDERRARARNEPGWCPAVERREARERARADAERERRRMTFRQYAEELYLPWAEGHQRAYRTTRAEVGWLVKQLGDRFLDTVTTSEVERVLAGLQAGRSPSGRPLSGAAVNRYRDRLSGMFKRALRLGVLERNPVTGIPKHKEPGGRTVCLTAEEEAALREALPATLRPMFVVSVNTGLRWSEQRGLTWADVDFLTDTITVRLSKHGHARQVPMNSTVRRALLDLATQREHPDHSKEPVFACPYRDASKFFAQAVARAQDGLRTARKDASRLEGYTWHGNRHTFASRLVMAGVDLRSVQELGGWRTLAMVQRYAHLVPEHLQAAVERLVAPVCHSALGRNLDSAGQAASAESGNAM